MAKLTNEEYDRLYEEFKAECADIAAECDEEFGLAYGSNYELRKEQLMDSDYYWPLFHEDDESDEEIESELC